MTAATLTALRRAQTIPALARAYADWLDYAHASRARPAFREQVARVRHARQIEIERGE